MSLVVLTNSEVQISRKPGDVLVTYSLGSCIGVTMYDPHLKLGGMIHYILPLSKVSPDRAADKPAMFADTGMPMLLRMMYEAGAARERLLVKAAGGSQLMEQNQIFDIGQRNYQVLKKILQNNGITLNNEDIGGHLTRTMRLEIDTGQTTVESSQGVREL